MPGPLVQRLVSVVGDRHVSTGVALSPYVIEGRTPEAAVFPGSIDEVCAVVRIASDAGVAVVPWGGGTAAHVGMPAADPALVLGLGRLQRIVEHEPADLTATVEAGVTIAALQARLGTARQWLSLDPPDPGQATLGGVVAANASGPRRHLYGTMRDLLIGITVVTGEGEVVRGGGKVVKNVAGYDLPKLFVGSYGTLAVIVELTVRLRPLPDVERIVAVAFPSMKEAAAGVRAVMASDLIPNAVDLLDAESARALHQDGAAVLVIGFDGLDEQVEWQCAELARLVASSGGGDPRLVPVEVAPLVGTAARHAWSEPASIMRCCVLPTQVSDMIDEGGGSARARGLRAAWSAHAGVGVVTGVLAAPPGSQAAASVAAVLADWRAIARANGGWAVLEWAPLAVKTTLPVWDDLGASGRIMQRIKAQLDPKGILNPGRFVAGI